MQVTTINDQPTLLIDRPLTADTTPPAAVTDGMTTITTTVVDDFVLACR